jgi:hypothetical protein
MLLRLHGYTVDVKSVAFDKENKQFDVTGLFGNK